MPKHPIGELWGGLAAMLVALPSAIAFGVTIFAPLGASEAAAGAVAGIIGAVALGLVAPLFGGTDRLITAPCAPAAAVLAAFAAELALEGFSAETAVALIALVALACGALQVGLGVLGVGRLIKYMPYPVVSGYLSGVGLVIIVSQVPKLLGVDGDTGFLDAVSEPALWNAQSIVVGVATVVVMSGAGRVIKSVPAAILGLAAGVAAYFILARSDPSLRDTVSNPMVIGPLASTAGGFGDAVATRVQGLLGLEIDHLRRVVMPALTLAVLLSIDTLKTCVVLDALTRSRHDSNRELIGQGLANLVSTAGGGVPGAGQMGATLVNMSSGGQTRLSSVMEGVLSLIAFLALGALVAWVPIAALAGILIVIGARMIDWRSLKMVRSRDTLLDFVVIAAVIVVAKTVSLIAASAVGVGLAILLYVREQTASTVVARAARGNRMFSRQMRLPEERAMLESRGEHTAIFELQGSLFFGTTDQLYRALEPELAGASYVVLDLRRVQSVDVTAAHMLEQAVTMLAERGGTLLFSALPRHLPSGRDMERYFSEVGLVRAGHGARVFDELDQALEWVEGRILEEGGATRQDEAPLELVDIDIVQGRQAETVEALRQCVETRSYRTGERIFSCGDDTDELYLIRRGVVRIVLPIDAGQEHHLASFGRGDFFGEMAFLDREIRSAHACASSDTELFVLSRERFEDFAREHRAVAVALFQGLARSLAVRLRYTNAELRELRGS